MHWLIPLTAEIRLRCTGSDETWSVSRRSSLGCTRGSHAWTPVLSSPGRWVLFFHGEAPTPRFPMSAWALRTDSHICRSPTGTIFLGLAKWTAIRWQRFVIHTLYCHLPFFCDSSDLSPLTFWHWILSWIWHIAYRQSWQLGHGITGLNLHKLVAFIRPLTLDWPWKITLLLQAVPFFSMVTVSDLIWFSAEQFIRQSCTRLYTNVWGNMISHWSDMI